jgi:hypothetical protein
MKINFNWGKIIGVSADKEKIESSIKEYLSDPAILIPTDGIVNVSVFSGDPPFFTIMGVIGNSSKEILFKFSFPDGEKIKVS